MLVCQLHNHEAALVDGLELNTEEHGGDVRQDEGLVLLDENILGVGHLVVTDQHVYFRTDVDELGVCLVVHRDDVEAVVGAFHG